MAVYAIMGKLGSGKGKAGVQRLREYLRAGKKVATNCDIFLEHLMPQNSLATVIRVPDKPTASDLYMVGSGNAYIEIQSNIVYDGDSMTAKAPVALPRMRPGFDESHNGALVLDELGSWFNTRNFQDKGRAELLEYFIHARKYGWDIFFIMQNISQADKQLRDSLFEYVVRLNRLDRMRVPLLSPMIQLMSAGAMSGAMPRVHIAVVRLGSNPDGLIADRWIFRGDDLQDGYITTQVFTADYPHGVHSLLSAWHLSGSVTAPAGFVGPLRLGLDDMIVTPRASPPKPPHKHMTKFLVISMMFGVILGGVCMKIFGGRVHIGTSVAAVVEKKYLDVTGRGYFVQGATVTVVLSDGRAISNPLSFSVVGGAWEAQIAVNEWVKGTVQ